VSIYGVKDEQVNAYMSGEIKRYIDLYDKLFSKTSTKSDIYKINHRTGDSVYISPMTTKIFHIAQDFYNWSNKKFDISAGTLIDLWDIKNRKTFSSYVSITR